MSCVTYPIRDEGLRALYTHSDRMAHWLSALVAKAMCMDQSVVMMRRILACMKRCEAVDGRELLVASVGGRFLEAGSCAASSTYRVSVRWLGEGRHHAL